MHEALSRRAPDGTTGPPVLDEDGLLRFDGRWVAITDIQIPVVDLIVRNHGHLVRNADIQAAYGSAGGSATSGSVRTLVQRLRTRVAAVGLRLHVVRSRGVILEPDTGREQPIPTGWRGRELGG